MNTLRQIMILCQPHAAWMALSILLSTAATLANIGLMATSGWFITAMGLAGVGGVTINYFTPSAIIRTLAIVRTGGRYLERLVSHDATLRLLSSLRHRLFVGMVPLVPADTGDLNSGDVSSRLSSDTDHLELFFLRLLSPLAVAFLTMLVGAGLLASVSIPLSVASLIVFFLFGVAMPALSARLVHRHSRGITQGTTHLRQSVLDTLDGMASLTMSGIMEARISALHHRMEAILRAERRIAHIAAFGQRGVDLAAAVSVLIALWILVPDSAHDPLSGPDLTMVLLGLLATVESLAPLPESFSNLAGTLESAKRIFTLLKRPASITAPHIPAPLPTSTTLHLNRVGVQYPGRDRPALCDITLTLEAGTCVAVVGESGAGKSTLLDLLLRFQDPSSGHITLGGTDLRTLALDDVRSQCCAVRQNPYLISATVMENLLLGRPDAPQAIVDHAMDTACFKTVAEGLSDGVNTFIGTAGACLSGGEARRLAVARALVTDPPILILDEPGEGLDAKTEMNLMTHLIQAVKTARHGHTPSGPRTLLVMVQRRAGLTAMDRILVLSQGRLVDDGPPAEVMARRTFQTLFDSHATPLSTP